jgi:hypothetical protein
MSKSTKNTNTNTNSASKLADLREELARSQDRIEDLESQLAAASGSGSGSGIVVANFVSPGEFAHLNLPVSFDDHPTRAALLEASSAASDELSAADTILGLWRWIASEEGLRPLLAKEIGKTSGIDSPLGETIQAIRKATKAFAATSKKSSAKFAERRAAAAEAKAAALEAKLQELLASGKFDL